ncbi:carboxymuconolactone decarboxylase family protein, partial [Ellagibacter isourolithinifaciens]|uniref:carboxymuconolactone decarboxylase family protein n=1 Tax=Ellagibacter isourolithinifaciens TaxID=2137581 RepID=UPI003AB00430
MAIKQTAGHDALGKFAPEFAHLNDDILFGEVWSREDKLPLKLRSIVTVSALIGKGIVDSSLKYHLASAKKNGVTQEEMAEILTHIAFYAGWPNAWAAFNMAKEVYVEDGTDGAIGEGSAGDTAGSGSPESHGGFFGLGEPNDAYTQYFTGRSFLKPLTVPGETVFLANVTFE